MKRFKWFALPYFIFLLLLVCIPVVVLIVLSFTKTDGVSFNDASVTFDNWKQLRETYYLTSIWNSLKIAAISTIICIVVGYLCAYIISFSHLKRKILVLLCLILPMWTNNLIRIIAWEKLFNAENMFNIPWSLIGNEWAVIFVTVTTYLPFMIYPIYNVLEKLDRTLLEASKDLGVPAWKTFFKVTLPLSMKGILSGTIMVFLPAATGFAISERIGGGNVLLIGNIIQNYFDKAFNFNLGAVLAILIAIVMMLLIFIFQRSDKEDKKA